MILDDKIVAAAPPKDDDFQTAEVACSAEFSDQGCKDATEDAE